MSIRHIFSLFAALLPLTLLSAAHASESVKRVVNIESPWARATPPVATTGAAYLEIKASALADSLVGATTPVAERVEIHSAVEVDGVMQMRQVKGVPIAAGESLRLAPGGMHLMLVGLQAPLVEGKPFLLTLRFKYAGDVTVEVQVRKDAPAAGRPRS